MVVPIHTGLPFSLVIEYAIFLIISVCMAFVPVNVVACFKCQVVMKYIPDFAVESGIFVFKSKAASCQPASRHIL